jgi:hypothetical protein
MKHFLAVALICIPACRDQPRQADVAPAPARPPAEQQVAEKRAAGPAQKSPLGFRTSSGRRAAPEVVIDGEAAELTYVGGIAQADNGTIAVIQYQDRAVRLFDSNGKGLASFGRPGGGPGEFQNPTRVGWFGDTLWVWDPLLNRITYRAMSTQAVQVVTIQAGERHGTTSSELPPIGITTVRAVYRNGDVLVLAEPRDPLPAEFAARQNQRVFLRTAGAGGSHRPIDWVSRNREGTAIYRSAQGGASAVIPFYAREIEANSVDGERIAVAKASISGRDAGTYKVAVIKQTGDTVFSRHFPFKLERIPKRISDSVLADHANRGQTPAMREVFHHIKLPDAFNPLLNIWIASDYSVWIRLFAGIGVPDRRYLILSPNGVPLDTLILPAKSFPYPISATALWVSERDEFDVPSLVRYRLH